MLRERTIKLVAAFDHRDIFIDPAPIPTGAAERQPCFDLPRSSWQDYDRALSPPAASPRSMKEITLSKEAQAALGFAKAKATPQEVIRAILAARRSALFGGIGTYVRASSRPTTPSAAGNDPIRLTGAQLRVKVIGEAPISA